MPGMFGIIIVLIVIIAIAGFSSLIRRNRRMDEANEEYRSAAREADQAICRANHALDDLAEIVFSGTAKARVSEIKEKKSDYIRLRNDAAEAISRAKSAGKNAYGVQRSGVRTQNMFLGGASDLSALSLYKRQDELAEIGISETLNDPSAVLDKANQIIHYQDMKQELLKEIAETGTIDRTTSPT